jgi:hypothetical protein
MKHADHEAGGCPGTLKRQWRMSKRGWVETFSYKCTACGLRMIDGLPGKLMTAMSCSPEQRAERILLARQAHETKGQDDAENGPDVSEQVVGCG